MFTAIGIITTIVVARFAMRAMRYRWHRHHHGPFGGCGFAARRHGRHRPWQGPMNLADFGDASPYGDWDDFGARNPRGSYRAPRVEDILKGLELNERQSAEASDVLAILHATVRDGAQVALALRAASRETFDADLAAAAIGPRISPTAAREALDALEHLHIILTEEQRHALDRATARA